jgi:hypothetical protein
MHLQECGGDEKGKNTRVSSLASSGRERRGEAMGWVRARAHDVRVNSQLKSGPKPRSSTTSFCH